MSAATGTTAGAGTALRFMLRRERRGLPWWLLGVTALVLLPVGGQPEPLRHPGEARPAAGDDGRQRRGRRDERPHRAAGDHRWRGRLRDLRVRLDRGRPHEHVPGRPAHPRRRGGRPGRADPLGPGGPQRARWPPRSAWPRWPTWRSGCWCSPRPPATGLPVAGSALFGAAMAGVGLTFAALTAVAAQVFENHRAVYGAVGAALGAAFLLRAAGDVGNGVLSWVSPIGWGQQTLPVRGRPLVAAAPAGRRHAWRSWRSRSPCSRGATSAPAWSRPGPGRPTPRRALGTPLGLAWRLQRGSLIGWAVGLFVLGAAYGSFADSMEQFVADNPEIAEFFPGGADAVAQLLPRHHHAVHRRSSPRPTASAARCGPAARRRPAGPSRSWPPRTSRWAWLGSHVTVALAGSAVVLLAAGLGEGPGLRADHRRHRPDPPAHGGRAGLPAGDVGARRGRRARLRLAAAGGHGGGLGGVRLLRRSSRCSPTCSTCRSGCRTSRRSRTRPRPRWRA